MAAGLNLAVGGTTLCFDVPSTVTINFSAL